MGNMKKSDFEGVLRSTVKEMGIASPSRDFTNKVMDQVRREPLAYRPLISPIAWVLMALVVTMLFVLLLANDRHGILESRFLSQNGYLSGVWGRLPSIAASDIVVYGFMVLAFFMSIEVALLRRRIERFFS